MGSPGRLHRVPATAEAITQHQVGVKVASRDRARVARITVRERGREETHRDPHGTFPLDRSSNHVRLVSVERDGVGRLIIWSRHKRA